MIVSLSHEHDLDGLGSQAIIKRYFKKVEHLEIELYDAQYLNFIERIEEILSKKTLPDQLIISDLGFNEDFRKVFPLFRKAIRKGCFISWFDHHLVEKEVINELENLLSLYRNDFDKCAAEIVKDYYLPQDKIAIRIAELARDSDFNTRKFELASEIQTIIGFNRGDAKREEREKIVSLLAEGDFENPWFETQLHELEEWVRVESKLIDKHLIRLDIDNLGEIVISFAKIGGGKICLLLREKYPHMKAYIGIDLRFNEITVHSDFINCRNFARFFKGGGHVMRAGFKYTKIFTNGGNLSSEFVKDIKKTLPRFKK